MSDTQSIFIIYVFLEPLYSDGGNKVEQITKLKRSRWSNETDNPRVLQDANKYAKNQIGTRLYNSIVRNCYAEVQDD